MSREYDISFHIPQLHATFGMHHLCRLQLLQADLAKQYYKFLMTLATKSKSLGDPVRFKNDSSKPMSRLSSYYKNKPAVDLNQRFSKGGSRPQGGGCERVVGGSKCACKCQSMAAN